MHIAQLAAGVSVVLALAAACYRLTRTGRIDIASDPPGAMVYLDGEYKGATPLHVRGLSVGEHLVKIAKFGRKPWIRNIRVGAARERIDVRLADRPTGVLVVTSEPDGAAVFVDGERKGETPLTVDGVELGEHELRISKQHFTPQDATVEVSEPKRVEVHYTLSSETEALYLAAIRRSPDGLFNYIELAHHYVLAHRFQEAMAAFKQAFPRAKKHGLGHDDSFDHPVLRLYDEMRRVHEPQYKYGDEEDVKVARQLVEKTLEEQIEKHPEDYLARYSLAEAYSRMERKADATRHLVAASEKCNNAYMSKRISRLLRQSRGW